MRWDGDAKGALQLSACIIMLDAPASAYSLHQDDDEDDDEMLIMRTGDDSFARWSLFGCGDSVELLSLLCVHLAVAT